MESKNISTINDFLEIRYDAFPWDDVVEDFQNIELFKIEIDQNYNNIIKANPVGRGGGAYEFVIHFISNISLEEYLKIIIIYLSGKTIEKIVDKPLEIVVNKYIFIPLKNAYAKLKQNNPILDCVQFCIEFNDINIFIYKTSNDSVFNCLQKIIEEISIHIQNIKKIEGYKATEIHIPVVLDKINNLDIYRVPLGISETLEELDEEDYFQFWGIKYCYNQLNIIYDIKNKVYINKNCFYTEQEFIDFLGHNV